MISPYSDCYIIEFEDGQQNLERVPYQYIKSAEDTTHTVLDGETIFSISNWYYGDPGAWGIIADANNLYNVNVEVVPGLLLIIPQNG